MQKIKSKAKNKNSIGYEVVERHILTLCLPPDNVPRILCSCSHWQQHLSPCAGQAALKAHKFDPMLDVHDRHTLDLELGRLDDDEAFVRSPDDGRDLGPSVYGVDEKQKKAVALIIPVSRTGKQAWMVEEGYKEAALSQRQFVFNRDRFPTSVQGRLLRGAGLKTEASTASISLAGQIHQACQLPAMPPSNVINFSASMRAMIAMHARRGKKSVACACVSPHDAINMFLCAEDDNDDIFNLAPPAMGMDSSIFTTEDAAGYGAYFSGSVALADTKRQDMRAVFLGRAEPLVRRAAGLLAMSSDGKEFAEQANPLFEFLDAFVGELEKRHHLVSGGELVPKWPGNLKTRRTKYSWERGTKRRKGGTKRSGTGQQVQVAWHMKHVCVSFPLRARTILIASIDFSSCIDFIDFIDHNAVNKINETIEINLQ